MMSRNFPNWLSAFTDFASFSEAPPKMHYWAGVSAIAGALRKKVWIDQKNFRWTPNFFIVFVAKPGIVSKSTTVDTALDLLREVPGINFGPDVLTWQSLPTELAKVAEEIPLPDGTFMKMSAMTCAASEFGNFIKPSEQEMIDMLVSLWDGRRYFTKVTKNSGSDILENPWINLIGCTTPAWVAGNFPEYMVGGGFASRCIFIHAKEKHKFVAYPGLFAPAHYAETRKLLIQDLEHMAFNLTGEFALTKEAADWGTAWYERHWKEKPDHLADARLEGYIARKQTHIHKLAMVIAASQRDKLIISSADLQEADTRVSELEKEMAQVFSLIGRSDISIQTERFIQFVLHKGLVDHDEAYRHVHAYFPDAKQFDSIVEGAIKAGYIKTVVLGAKNLFKAI